jgi:hypothetical protein
MTDRDVRLAQVLDRFTPALPEYRHDWQDVLGRAQSRRYRLARPSRRLGVLAVAVVAGVVAVTLGVTTPWKSAPGLVEAQVVGRAEAALALPSGTVLHMKLEDSSRDASGKPTTITTELWLSHDGVFHGFVDDPTVGERVEIGGTQDLRRSVEYDPRTNAIGPGLVGGTFYSFGDDVRVLRRQLARGAATADGETTIGGRRVLRIRLRSVGPDCKPVADYLFVDPKTYDPVEYRVTDFGSRAGTKPPTTYYRIPAIRRFRTFERLPATSANLRLSSIEAMHPTAKVYPPVTTRPPLPPCASPR